VAGCAPQLDWREVQPRGFALKVALPCRPTSVARELPLAGQQVSLTLYACSERGLTFAIASAEVGDPMRVGAVLTELGAAAIANVHGRVIAGSAADVNGMTPHPAALRWRIEGRLPDGQPVVERLVVFSRGARVYQATLIGRQIDDDTAAAFFDSLRLST
jgi:hypothetical protein